MKEEIYFENEIFHVLHSTNDLFLVLTKFGAYKINRNLPKAKIEKIELEENPNMIRSGTTLKNNYFFLHVKVDNSTREGRIYTFDGKLISRKILPDSLR